MKLSETRQQLVQTIIESLEKGVKPWNRGYSLCKNSLGVAKSLSSSKPYRGVNQWILQATASQRGYASAWHGTFNQIKTLGGSVNKGAKGVRVCFYKSIEKTDCKGKPSKFLLSRTYCVFNVQDTNLEQYKAGYAQSSRPAFDRFEKADQLFENAGLDIRTGGNKAFYSLTGNYIQMPFESQFESQNQYYGTLCHEAIHNCERLYISLDRSKFDEPYAFGELVAELGSCLLMNELGIEQTNFDNSCSYLSGWLKKFKSDPSWLFKASSWVVESRRFPDAVFARQCDR